MLLKRGRFREGVSQISTRVKYMTEGSSVSYAELHSIRKLNKDGVHIKIDVNGSID
jgi:hypothetical protein